ncbi:MAG: 3'(2'),5'-bisphosphate nucleotidase CysQ [Myxococcales bacterium]|nr:3'(2'),5'-bisphosphate nucleotidase CysQ [Myxococcales bacterium]
MSYARELEHACAMASEAGKLLIQIYETAFGYELKEGASPVTEADRVANSYLVDALRQAFPTDGVVAEESRDMSDALHKTRCWYVDPLDGTKEFIRRNGEFSVMLGLAIEGQATLGVVYQPVTDKLYSGIVGKGATLQRDGEKWPLRVTNTSTPSELRFVSSRSHRSSETDELLAQLGIHQKSVSGSVGLKAGLIAEEQADLYVHLSDKSCAWDACAPEAIVRAAGGCFTDLRGKPFVYGGTDLRNRHGIIACNKQAFDHVLPVIRSVGESMHLL